MCTLMKLTGQVGETVIIPQEINSLRILFCPEFVTKTPAGTLSCSCIMYGCLVDSSQVCNTVEQSCSHISVSLL